MKPEQHASMQRRTQGQSIATEQLDADYNTHHRNLASEPLAALIVAYFPDDNFYARVPTIAAGVRQLAIYDNGGLDRDRLRSLASNVEVIGDGSNDGVAAALNRGCAWAKSSPEPYRWLITLDQDSSPTPEMWSLMLDTAQACFPIGMIGLISPCYQPGDSIAKLSFRNGFERQDRRNTLDCGRVWITMTSGNLLHIEAHEKIGGFDEDYFIDQVDHEYCLRLNASGYVVCEIAAAVLNHPVGTVLKVQRLGRLWQVSSHNAVRVRYQTRNLAFMARRHTGIAPVVIGKLAYEFLSRMLRLQLLLSAKEASTLRRSIVQGIRDAVAHRRGPLPLNSQHP